MDEHSVEENNKMNYSSSVDDYDGSVVMMMRVEIDYNIFCLL